MGINAAGGGGWTGSLALVSVRGGCVSEGDEGWLGALVWVVFVCELSWRERGVGGWAVSSPVSPKQTMSGGPGRVVAWDDVAPDGWQRWAGGGLDGWQPRVGGGSWMGDRPCGGRQETFLHVHTTRTGDNDRRFIDFMRICA